jgi:hypothetical protein
MCRPTVFYRGYDVVDTTNVGFLATRCDEPVQRSAACEPIPQSACIPSGKGWKYDTNERGNSPAGHDYGTDLAVADKQRLIAFLKTL